MKNRIYLLVLILLLTGLPVVHSQEYGKIRALKQRADSIITQKNDFVARVLTAYAIPYERNAQGAVVRINTDGRWLDVTAIEIVPVLKEGTDKQVTAHELLFTTANGVLTLFSELAIR